MKHDRYFTGADIDYEEPDAMGELIAEALEAATVEAERARTLHPAWPSDLIHCVAVVNEEAGEMVKAANECVYMQKGTTLEDVYEETIHTMAMCIRLLTETPGLIEIMMRDKWMPHDDHPSDEPLYYPSEWSDGGDE